MKRLVIISFAVLLSSISYAESTGQITLVEYKIPPATTTSSVTISAAGAGLRNCLTNLTVISNSTYTISVTDAGSDIFSLLMAEDAGLVKDWRIENPLCASPDSYLGIIVDNGTYSINYQGVVISK